MASNRYIIEGRYRSPEDLKKFVANARGAASAAGRTANTVSAQPQDMEKRHSLRAAKKRERIEQREALEEARLKKAVAAGIRRSLRAEEKMAALANQKVRVYRSGRERQLPAYDRHAWVPLPEKSGSAGWARPSTDRDGFASLTLKIWAKSATGGRDQMASKARYTIDPSALAGPAEEVVFTNMLDANAAVAGTAGFEQSVVGCCRAIEEFENQVAKTVDGAPRAQIFKHIAIALPAGLSSVERARVARESLETLSEMKLPFVAAIQRPSQARGEKDNRNFHLQITVANRPFEKADGNGWDFAVLKDTTTLGPEGIREWRRHIVRVFNEALARDNVDVRFSSLTRAERGLVSSDPAPAAAEDAEQTAMRVQPLLTQFDPLISKVTKMLRTTKELQNLATDSRLKLAADHATRTWSDLISAEAERRNTLAVLGVSRRLVAERSRLKTAKTDRQRRLDTARNNLMLAKALRLRHTSLDAEHRLHVGVDRSRHKARRRNFELGGSMAQLAVLQVNNRLLIAERRRSEAEALRTNAVANAERQLQQAATLRQQLALLNVQDAVSAVAKRTSRAAKARIFNLGWFELQLASLRVADKIAVASVRQQAAMANQRRLVEAINTLAEHRAVGQRLQSHGIGAVLQSAQLRSEAAARLQISEITKQSRKLASINVVGQLQAASVRRQALETKRTAQLVAAKQRQLVAVSSRHRLSLLGVEEHLQSASASAEAVVRSRIPRFAGDLTHVQQLRVSETVKSAVDQRTGPHFDEPAPLARCCRNAASSRCIGKNR